MSEETKYRAALDVYKNGDHVRFNSYLASNVTWHAVLTGRDLETVLSDLRGRMVLKPEHVTDLRRGYDSALKKAPMRRTFSRKRRTFSRKRRTEEPTPVYTATVRDLLGAGGGSACAEDLAELSPVRVDGMAPEVQTVSFLRGLWRPSDVLFLTDKGADVGRIGSNIRTAGKWIEAVENGERLPGPLVTPNPITGRRGVNGAGGPSFTSADCLAQARPFALLEFDYLPEAEQCAFWLGFLMRSPLARNLVSLVHSGGRSVHGLVYVGAADPASWEAQARTLRELFCSDPETRYRADIQPLRSALTKTRIAGVTRPDSGKVQRLLYFNPTAARAYVDGGR